MRHSRFNPYRDRFASDGVISTGWRYVRKGGKVKIAGMWWQDPKLADMVGHYVQVVVGDYWMSHVDIFTGAIGCQQWYCTIRAEGQKG